MKKRFVICALGELLIDFTPVGSSPEKRDLFKKNPGGAPANVLAAVAKLGGGATFIGKVGKDQFGSFLKQELLNHGIDTSGLILSEDANTSLAFVHLNEKGDRSFTFYRENGADLKLSSKEIHYDLIEQSQIFHFGSLSLTAEPCRSATISALEHAKRMGKLISYDPNWRPALWKSPREAKENMLKGLSYADIVKVSDDELHFLTQEKELDSGADILMRSGAKVVVVTLGPKGCYFKYKGGSGFVNTYDTKVVDTTGAGDAFVGGFLYCLSRSRIRPEEILFEEFLSFMRFANATGSLCASRYGAIPSMPSREEVETCIRSVPLL